jgi:hypothetical protein
MRTGILHPMRVRKRLCVSVLVGKQSIYFSKIKTYFGFWGVFVKEIVTLNSVFGFVVLKSIWWHGLKIRRPPKLGVLEFSCVSHIPPLVSHSHILTLSYSLVSHIHILTLSYSHIVLLSYSGGGVWGGGLSCPPPNQAKSCFKLLMHTYYPYYTYYTYSLYLWDLYRMFVCTHKCLYEAIWGHLKPSGIIGRYLGLPGATILCNNSHNDMFPYLLYSNVPKQICPKYSHIGTHMLINTCILVCGYFERVSNEAQSVNRFVCTRAKYGNCRHGLFRFG